MSKRRGTLWIVSGLLLLFCAAGLTSYNYNLDKTAGEKSAAVTEELVSFLENVPARTVASMLSAEYEPAGSEMEVLELDGYQYIGLITFPTLEIQLPVQYNWSYPNLRISPCRMTGSPMTEDLVILAHNYTQHFGSLNQLESGDEVSVTLIDGTTYIYRVEAKEIVAPTAVKDVTSGEWPLTLFTCTLGGRTRLVIRCDAAA